MSLLTRVGKLDKKSRVAKVVSVKVVSQNVVTPTLCSSVISTSQFTVNEEVISKRS